MKYAEKYGVSRTSWKYNRSRSYICFWKARWDKTVMSLACQPRWPHSHPNQHTEAELKLSRDIRCRDPGLGVVKLWHRLRLFQYTAIDEFTRLRFLAAYPEQTTYSSADFLKRLVKWYVRRGIRVECFQTDSGFEFTNRFSKSKRDLSTLFETTAAQLAAHVTSSCVPIRPGTTLRRATASIRRCDSESRRRKR